MSKSLESQSTELRAPEETPAAPEVSVVVPCLNEAGTIAACVRSAVDALERNGYTGEVIVVDNGSTDGTVEEAERAGAIVVRQPIRGYGAACLRGFESARGRYLVLVDGDGTYDISTLHRFVEPLRAGYDLVLGTRRNGEMQPGSMRRRHLHLLEPIQTYLSRRFFAFTVSDVRCGMRGIRREALDRLRLGATGMEFASEMLLEAARVGLDTVEVPVNFRPRRAGPPRRSVEDGWRVARQLLLLSPTRLFLLPGLIFTILGLGLEAALLPGPIRWGAITLDYHFMFVGGALAILGFQLILLGIYAKTYALVHEVGRADLWIRRFHLHYTLERGVALGGVCFLAGLVVNLWILWSWIAAGRGVLFAVRPAMLALTLMVLGAEIVFASFFLSVLRSSGFGRV
jgi:glycosyltransferase involved in cell wall biosynthesis